MSARHLGTTPAPCLTCYGTGTCTDRNGNSPDALDIPCPNCEATGLECKACRQCKRLDEVCAECSLGAVEQLFEGVL